VVLRSLQVLCAAQKNRMFIVVAYFGKPYNFIINAGGNGIEKILNIDLD